MRSIQNTLVIVLALFAGSCNNSSTTEKNIAPMIKEENPAYTSDSANLTGFLAYDSANTSKRPVVFIIHEWWGLNDYVKSRAMQLAAMGYMAFAIDMYGDGKMGNNPDEAGKLAGPF